jgi:hypothetical protein
MIDTLTYKELKSMASENWRLTSEGVYHASREIEYPIF